MNIDPASGSQYRLSASGTGHLSKCDEVWSSQVAVSLPEGPAGSADYRSMACPGRYIRFTIGDLRPLLRDKPRDVVRLAWALHCARNDQSPRAIRIEADLLDALDAHGIAAPLVTVDVCPTCGQDLPQESEAS